MPSLTTTSLATPAAMAAPDAASDLLQRGIANPDTQWSLGTFGAIAEFSRDRDEAVGLTRSPELVSAVTVRGGIALRHHTGCRPFASESTTRTGWNQRIALCLPEDDCAMNRRAVLTELGADRDALRPQDRGSILFDLGLGAWQADFCVRLDDREAIARACRPRRVRSWQSADGSDPCGKSASCLCQPARPDRGLPADSARVGKKS